MLHAQRTRIRAFWFRCRRPLLHIAGQAVPCGTQDVFCDCERCVALPEKPTWMASPEAAVAMAERVVAARREDARTWQMHASAHDDNEDWSTASKSFTKAAKLYGDGGDAVSNATMLENAKRCRATAEAIAKAAAEAEAARMAPIMAAREAAANAAMEALLAEEEQEKAAAAAKAGKSKRKKKGRK